MKRHLYRAQRILPVARSIACSSAEHGNPAAIILATNPVEKTCCARIRHASHVLYFTMINSGNVLDLAKIFF